MKYFAFGKCALKASCPITHTDKLKSSKKLGCTYTSAG